MESQAIYAAHPTFLQTRSTPSKATSPGLHQYLPCKLFPAGLCKPTVQCGRLTPGKLHANSGRPQSDLAVAFREAKESGQAGSVGGKTGRASQRRVVARSARDEAGVLIEDAAQTLEDQLPEASNGAPQNGAPQNDEDSPDWRRVLPHVITAAFANFCFGYHIGALNGPLEQIAADLGFAGNTITQGVVVSTFLIGAFIGSVVGGPLSDAIGRRRTFQLDAIPLILGPALMASSHDVPSIVLGRLLVGIGVGVNTSLVPLYISEIAPTKYRGTLGSLCQIGTCIGIITVLLVGLPAKEVEGWWRTMFWLGTIPGFVIMGGMQFAAESPRWLGKVGKWDEAKKTLINLWGERFVDGAMADLRAVAEADKLEKDEASWGDMVSPRYRKGESLLQKEGLLTEDGFVERE